MSFESDPFLSRCVVLLVLAAGGCGGGINTIECTPPCPGGSHCTESGCVPDDGPAHDLAVAPARDLALACSSLCAAPTPYCNANGQCVPCVEDAHCAAGSYCHVFGNTSVCLPGCTGDTRCGPGQKCCGNTCADTATDPLHCGDCDTRCAPPHAAGACAGGKCGAGACDPA